VTFRPVKITDRCIGSAAVDDPLEYVARMAGGVQGGLGRPLPADDPADIWLRLADAGRDRLVPEADEPVVDLLD
jgi:hypothetical protein